MAARDFASDDARARVKRVIAELEAQRSAEVVVAVRPSSGDYRHIDYLVGFAAAFASLLVFIFHPRAMRSDVFPIEQALVFVLGAAVSRLLPPLRRVLSSRKRLDENVERAARAAFVELGVSRTRERTGILVYASLLERDVRVVADIGVPDDVAEKLSKALVPAVRDADLSRFVSGLGSTGKALARALPRRANDENELPDEVHVA